MPHAAIYNHIISTMIDANAGYVVHEQWHALKLSSVATDDMRQALLPNLAPICTTHKCTEWDVCYTAPPLAAYNAAHSFILYAIVVYVSTWATEGEQLQAGHLHCW